MPDHVDRTPAGTRRAARPKSRLFAALAAALALAFLAVAAAQGQLPGPLNDLFAIGQGGGETPAAASIQKPAEPPFVATPVAGCDAASHPEPGVDGRVPAGSATHGLWCNMTLIGHQGTEGGFKVFRYVDAQNHVCAFYDSTLMFPLNALNPSGGSEGVVVLDMSDPAHPVQTDTLTSVPMLSPHESLNLNVKRGLLAAVNGNLSTYPGFVAVYDVQKDCRHPVLDALGPYARFGHESAFSPDGKTFYASSTALQSVTAIDLTDPTQPHAIWQGNVYAHGMTTSDDGNRLYVADPKGNLLILDTSQIQARKPNPQTREVSRITWNEASIPQNAIPFSENGHPYLLEFDEYTQQTLNPSGDPDMVGAARIVDIANEAKPTIVANLRLAIDQPAEHAAARAAQDPGANNAAQGYAAHYCNVPTEVDPKIVACSFIASGLRVFDISDLVHPKEIGYYVAPPDPRSENEYMASDFAMSKPAFDMARHEIWWTDGTSGFYVVRLDDGVWPQAGAGGVAGSAPAAAQRPSACASRRSVTLRVPRGLRRRVRSVRIVVGHRVVARLRRGVYAKHVDLRRFGSGRLRVRIVMRLAGGRTVTVSRVLPACP